MYFLYYQTKNHGPYALDQIRSMWASGIITADAVYWVQAESVWKPIAELLATARTKSTSAPEAVPVQQPAASAPSPASAPTQQPRSTKTEPLRYAGFWPRLLSLLLDAVIYLPLGALVFWGYLNHRLFALYYLIPGTLFGLFFNVYLVERFGGTPGKLIAGIRIRKVDGQAVGYREAFFRYLPALILGLLISTAMVASVSHITDARYQSLSFMGQAELKAKLAPSWYQPILLINQIWFWGEMLILLTNRKRRALHDFIAGTVVVRVSPVSKNEPEGVEGWLGVFVVSLIFLIPATTVYSVVSSFQLIDALRSLNQSAANWLNTRMTLEAVLLFALAIFSLVTGILLVRRTRNAVLVAKIFTATVPVMTLAMLFATLSGEGPSDVRDELAKAGIMGLFQSVGYFAVWFTYLCRSRRVQNTYGDEALEGNPVQTDADRPKDEAHAPVSEHWPRSATRAAEEPAPPPAQPSFYRRVAAIVAYVVAAVCLLFILNELFGTGSSTPKDAKMHGVSDQSTARGDATAQFNLGGTYFNGEGVPKDEVKAAECYAKAAEQGEAGAQSILGWMYLNGRGVSKNDTKALEWFRYAAAQGNAVAQTHLGDMIYSGNATLKSYEIACAWYQRAAKQGEPFAQYKLGLAYWNGRGVPKDSAKSVEWFRKAAEQGNAEAQSALGVAYANGDGVKKDSAKAIELYEKAASQGYAVAQAELGLIYSNGNGVPKNMTKAIEYQQQAANQGNADAQCILGNIFLDGRGIAKDEAKAVEWYHKAAAQGNAQAQYNLGVMYGNGTGIPKDERKAIEWLRKAAAQGDPNAQAALKNRK
ncbi:MAG: RDD family protein [Verrucomicrobiota bacterium]